jgi:hypothetical protein
MKVQFLVLSSLILSSPVAGCGRCALVSSAEVRPDNEVVLMLGDTITAAYWVTGKCGNPPTSPTVVALGWWTPDTLVVRVDSLTGHVRGISSGDGRVWGRYPNEDATPINRRAEILVHVR